MLIGMEQENLSLPELKVRSVSTLHVFLLPFSYVGAELGFCLLSTVGREGQRVRSDPNGGLSWLRREGRLRGTKERA